MQGKQLLSESGMDESIERELTQWPVSRMDGRSARISPQLKSQFHLRLSIVEQVESQGENFLRRCWWLQDQFQARPKSQGRDQRDTDRGGDVGHVEERDIEEPSVTFKARERGVMQLWTSKGANVEGSLL